jgi:4-hydroxy-2-oxoheptanedioate aldolase
VNWLKSRAYASTHAPIERNTRLNEGTPTRENRIRTIWKAGGAVLNGWLAIPSGFSAETMAHQGWDSLTIDLEHGVVDYQAAVNMLTAISTTDTVPVVRVPWLDPGILMKMLDAGAYALICPMISTRADAEKLVAATHYQPRGTRSFGPIRALLYGGADYPTYANDTIVVFAQIETQQALDNLDDILSVEGLDAIYIGPSDLSLALGCTPTFDDVDKPAADAIDHILARAKSHGVVAGIHNGTPEAALRRIEKGFQFVTVGSDARILAAGAQQIVGKMAARHGMSSEHAVPPTNISAAVISRI